MSQFSTCRIASGRENPAARRASATTPSKRQHFRGRSDKNWPSIGTELRRRSSARAVFAELPTNGSARASRAPRSRGSARTSRRASTAARDPAIRCSRSRRPRGDSLRTRSRDRAARRARERPRIRPPSKGVSGCASGKRPRRRHVRRSGRGANPLGARRELQSLAGAARPCARRGERQPASRPAARLRRAEGHRGGGARGVQGSRLDYIRSDIIAITL
jgi:hypothetical protein